MAEALMRMYESMTEEAKKELYDFALLLVAKGTSAAASLEIVFLRSQPRCLVLKVEQRPAVA